MMGYCHRQTVFFDFNQKQLKFVLYFIKQKCVQFGFLVKEKEEGCTHWRLPVSTPEIGGLLNEVGVAGIQLDV